MRMTAGRDKRFLGYHNVMTDKDVILVVNPNTFPYPRTTLDMQLPRELDSSPWAKHNTVTDFCPEQP